MKLIKEKRRSITEKHGSTTEPINEQILFLLRTYQIKYNSDYLTLVEGLRERNIYFKQNKLEYCNVYEKYMWKVTLDDSNILYLSLLYNNTDWEDITIGRFIIGAGTITSTPYGDVDPFMY